MSLLRLSSPTAAADWLASHVQGTLHADSRALRPGDGFLAWPGASSDGRRFVPAALAAGAAACLVDDSDLQAFSLDDARIAALPGLKAVAGAVADLFFGQPSAALDVLAVTGTNGKTSTAWWLAQALALLGRRCGVMGTLGVGELPLTGGAGTGIGVATTALQPTGLTTPDALTVHAALRRFADAGLRACALEASSIGLVDQRLSAVRIRVALFTNFTRDHLDFHGSMASYWAAKRSLFDWPGLRAAVVNVDDVQGAALAAELKAEGTPDLWTVSCTSPARLQAQDLQHNAEGMRFVLLEAGAPAIAVSTPLVGEYNASNLLVVAAGLRALGLPLADIAAVLGRLQPVPGRLQRVSGDTAADVDVLVDYAHTPDALDKVLQALRPLAAARRGHLVCVFGCGGNRDASKRPLMGRIAEQHADRVVLTSDNPRHEDPTAILAQVLGGLLRPAAARVIEDRRDAIVHAITGARAGDVVLLAGKGHEQDQDVAGVKRPFSDIAEAQAALRLRQSHAAGAPA
jgi:UDP-N-acetylmuramoyl-L-alanyl-D-glutamate--2,6-diaminopimelate ligase